MADSYQPESRRPIAHALRRTADLAVQWCVRLDVHPNTISIGSTVAAATAALCVMLSQRLPLLLLFAPLLMMLRLWLNMLDGMVALASGKASSRGELYNELPDRVSDFVIFAGLAHSGWTHPALAYWSGGSALFVAYVGTFGQALGVGRQFGGVMAKQWRMVALSIGCFLVYILGAEPPAWGGLSTMDWVLVVILAGCVQTLWLRLGAIVAALDAASSNRGG